MNRKKLKSKSKSLTLKQTNSKIKIRRKTVSKKKPPRSFLFSPEDMPGFGREFCFLCGCTLPVHRNTDEHVIPRWIQQRYNLWNQRLTLLNRTTIPYRQLLIPCCYACNNKHLSKIELQVQKACDKGYQAVKRLAPEIIFLWLGKILYGLLYREHLLSLNLKNPSEGPIVPKEFLNQFQLHHQFLQAARVPFSFYPHVPASFFIYETMEPSDPKKRFDYWDDMFHMGLSIRVGKVGIIACLQDGGAVNFAFKNVYKRYKSLALHSMQFAELTAMTFYDLRRFNRVPKFMLVEGKEHVQVVLNPLGGLSGKPLFDQGNIDEYAKVLAHCARLPLEIIHPKPDLVMSWLHESGKVKQMNADDDA